jgi:hypothetical protein
VQLLADKYGLREDELAPKLARMAKQGFPVREREPAGSGGSAAPSGSAGGGAKQSPSVTVSLQPTSGDTAGAPHRGNAAAAVASVQAEQKVQAVKLLQQATALQQQQQQAAAATAAASGVQQQAAIAQQVAALQQQQQQQQQQAGTQGIGGPASMVAANVGMLLDDAFLDEVGCRCACCACLLGAGRLAVWLTSVLTGWRGERCKLEDSARRPADCRLDGGSHLA